MEETKRGRGRPKGKRYPVRVQAYFDAEGMRLLDALAEKATPTHGPRGHAEVIRLAVRLMAEKEGVK